MPHRHTHQDADPLFRPTPCESVTRDAHGQSLDDARETFRAEWQAKIGRKWDQAERAKRTAVLLLERVAELVVVGTTGFGVLLGCLIGFQRRDLATGLTMSFHAATIGVLLSLVLVGVTMLSSWFCHYQAERLEQEAQELERS